MSVIDKEIMIEASREEVWRHLQEPDLLAAWLMRTDFKPEAGARFHFWSQPKEDWDGIIRCEVVEVDPPRRLSFTWNHNALGCDTLVTIDLEPRGKGTLVRLLHTNWEGATGDLPSLIEGHTRGWTDHLWVLRKQAEEAGGRTPPPVDWTRFRLFVRIETPAEPLFRAWATSRGMESFFVEMMQIRDGSGRLRAPDAPAEAGDAYVWRWNSGARVAGRYLEVEPDRLVSFTFGESKVSVSLHPRDGWTLMELQQSEMKDTPENRMHLHTNCRGGWIYFLTILKTLMEHGVDGRDRTRATGGAFSTYFDPRTVGREA